MKYSGKTFEKNDFVKMINEAFDEAMKEKLEKFVRTIVRDEMSRIVRVAKVKTPKK